MKMKDTKCCTPENTEESIRKTIRERYGEYARRQTSNCCGPNSGRCSNSCTLDTGYTPEEIEKLPENASAASAGCGNPVTLSNLKEGETVLDLGSGGGIDVLLAAKKVGSTGKAIGVDITPDMIELARRNARESGLDNVEFRLGEIENLPVADDSVDVLISNCVINLSANKDAVFRESYRVLRSGGRLVISDVMARDLPQEARDNLLSWAGCIGGAITLEDYVAKIEDAGFNGVEVLSSADYPHEYLENSLRASGIDSDPGNAVLSHAEIYAVKP